MRLTILLVIVLIFILGCQVDTSTKPKLNTSTTKPITTLPKVLDLTGHWEGQFSFTNNCIADATCTYHGKPGSVKMDIVHNMTSLSVKNLAVDYSMFTAEYLFGGDADEACPTIKELGVLRGDIPGLKFEDNRFTFVDYFDNIWDLYYKDGILTGNVDSDDPGCMGMRSRDVVLSRE